MAFGCYELKSSPDEIVMQISNYIMVSLGLHKVKGKEKQSVYGSGSSLEFGERRVGTQKRDRKSGH